LLRLAAIDLGTNSVRLLIAEPRGPAWHALGEAQEVTRLGEGQGRSGALGEAPMTRTAAVVADYVGRAERAGAGAIRIVATSAVRAAPNRDAFVDLVRRATGRHVEVLSGDEEARLALLGVASGLPELGGDFVLLDIGGGSTEFVLAGPGRSRAAVSLRLGVVALAERFVDAGPVPPDRFAAMLGAVAAQLDAELPASMRPGLAPVLVGTAGTVTTLAALDLDLARYDADRVQGHVLGRAAIERQRDRVAALSVAERAALPVLEPGRADILVPGIAILLAAMGRLGFDALVVSDRGLREGLVCEMLGPRSQ
jgi:exopolyphosphatase / guanosine-5'-triphosphate,3'-diphosphate pyrophosphatase